jgi:hypothetical protein
MALPLPVGLVPSEVAFLCEMELVTVVPRQRLDSMDLLGVSPHPRPALRAQSLQASIDHPQQLIIEVSQPIYRDLHQHYDRPGGATSPSG